MQPQGTDSVSSLPGQTPTVPPGMYAHTSKHLHSAAYMELPDTELNQNNPSLGSIHHVHVRTEPLNNTALLLQYNNVRQAPC